MGLLRFLPGQPPDIAGEAITSYSLVRNAIANPDLLPLVWQLFKDEEAPLSALLGMKGLYTKGLRDNSTMGGYRVVKSNHVMFAIKNTDRRKLHFVPNANGVTYVDDANAATGKIGYGKVPFYIWLNSNWARPNEIIELSDNTTQLFIYNEEEPKYDNGAYRYEVVLHSNNREDYLDPELLAANAEAGVGMTAYEHDFSETGSQKYTFDTWGHAYMTLQRVMMSISGTAEAMGESKEWHMFQSSKGKNAPTYVSYAEKEMLRRIAEYHEYQVLFGKGSVDIDGNVVLHNKRGREIMTGDGILNQGEGAYEYPMNGEWVLKFLENVMMDVDIRSGEDGLKEVVFGMGLQSLNSFNRMMRKEGFVTQNNNVEGTGANKGVINTYGYYEMNNVRVIPKHIRWMDDPGRPSKWLSDGTRKSSWDCIAIPIGNMPGGDRMIELVQLRPMVQGTVNGMNKGGDGMATSVDGKHTHVLIQSGVVFRGKAMRIFRHYKS